MIVVLMGVSGCGKTTVGERLAAELGWAFIEGDELQPAENVRKMSSGVPLSDEDRWPWLARLRAAIDERVDAGESAVIACSALKASYRRALLDGIGDTRLIHLRGDFETIERRLRTRTGHFFDPALLASQFETLEEPADVLTVDISRSPPEIVVAILRDLGGASSTGRAAPT